jgi:hypothetical protein
MLGDWAASVDLKDAYFHVPIAGGARKCLHFSGKGRLVQVCVLPFGLSPGGFQDQSSLLVLYPGLGIHFSLAPCITMLAKRVKAMLGRLDVRTILYLDDILVLGFFFQLCLSKTKEALSMVMKAGFIINWEKSSLVPTTNFLFLEMLWYSVEGVLTLPEDKLEHLQAQAAFLLWESARTCQQVLVLTGYVAVFTGLCHF